ncbi:exodeoxyribonuclease VII large subunit [Fervidibacillus halotolerans]|uniref:Exodeoxyribonuclease 7 large subunit n=1 Tax=Fervidibacillus halotolerans TaxID=2980027 RepID=A0A9E8LY32_9BACI|nr:exodeoxyribonuclease VII large subunit [Fervidibacillus halotolerans]WAA11420.1 exodeoxyribonuclease VII large subunit [Fervidibacillus halotolerans]
MDEIQYLTVKALTKYIKRKFDFDPHLQNIFVKGEISNFKRHSNGNIYFTLKDENARISAVMFSNYARQLRFFPGDGMNVFVRGEVTVYEPNGQYQLYVKEMQPDGIGELYLAFEQLKKKLEKEGLFKKERKRPIPLYPHSIGVVTSPTGAAIRDIITTIKRRYPLGRIFIYPALVQGKDAAQSIVKAIHLANERKEVDVLIVGRGGGSIEELWPFNEEIVARAIDSSTIPIISAVGHETDVTISDFVADLRAPTPTGAAELAVPSVNELMEKINNRKIRLIKTIKNSIEENKRELNRLKHSYVFRNPQKLYEQKMEMLDRTFERMNRSMKLLLSNRQQTLKHVNRLLLRHHPEQKLLLAKEKYINARKRLTFQAESIFQLKEGEFKRMIRTLEALNPLKIMDRGYSITYGERGNIIKSVDHVQIDDSLRITVNDGQIHAKVTGKIKGEEKENG